MDIYDAEIWENKVEKVVLVCTGMGNGIYNEFTGRNNHYKQE